MPLPDDFVQDVERHVSRLAEERGLLRSNERLIVQMHVQPIPQYNKVSVQQVPSSRSERIESPLTDDDWALVTQTRMTTAGRTALLNLLRQNGNEPLHERKVKEVLGSDALYTEFQAINLAFKRDGVQIRIGKTTRGGPMSRLYKVQ